ncbi:STAS domain-containing protein [Nonomuraea zeae]|nr:STAS domain-containing protein [Nonomuraea zeae]
MMHLAIRLVPVGATTLIIALTGELDATTRAVLPSFLDPIPQSPVTDVIVEATHLWFCDVNGLAQLAITQRAMQAKGGRLAVAEAHPPLCSLIALMSERSELVIPLYTGMPEALSGTDVEMYEAPAPPAPVRPCAATCRACAPCDACPPSATSPARTPSRRPESTGTSGRVLRIGAMTSLSRRPVAGRHTIDQLVHQSRSQHL